MRPASSSCSIEDNVATAASKRCASSSSTNRAILRCATAMDVAESSAVATPVTRSASSWASSTTSSSYSGSTEKSESASMASSA